MFAKIANFFLRRKRLLKLSTRSHVMLYRVTGGWLGGFVSGLPNLLLTTIGRKSGLERTTPLFFLYDGARFIVVASYGGNPKEPLWWKNLQANPQGWAEVGDQKFAITASQADEELKQKMWPVFARHYPAYEDYKARTERVIPLVVLTPQ